MQLFSILDRKLKEFGPVVVMKNEAAIRRALVEANDGKSGMFKYPDDFDVYLLGDFDVETGVILPCGVPVVLDSVFTILGGG